MNPRITKILGLLVALALIALVALEMTKAPTDEDRLMWFDASKLETVTIENSGVAIEFMRANYAMPINDWPDKRRPLWKVTSPLEDYADSDAVDDLVELLYTNKVIDWVKEVDDTKLKELGLLEPQQRLVLGLGKGEEKEIHFGITTASDDGVYVKRIPGGEVALVGIGLRDAALRGLDEFRYPKVQPMEPRAVDYLEVSRPATGENLELKLENGFWRIRKPLQARGKNQVVFELISSLTQAAVITFSEDVPQPETEDQNTTIVKLDGALMESPVIVRIREDGFRSPSGKKDKSSRPAESGGEIEEKRASAWLEVEGRPGIFEVDETAARLAHVSVDEMRDRSIVGIPAAAIPSFTISTPPDKPGVEITHRADGWHVTDLEQGTIFRADDDMVRQFLTGISQADVAEFLSDVGTETERYGVDMPSYVIEMKINRELVIELLKHRAPNMSARQMELALEEVPDKEIVKVGDNADQEIGGRYIQLRREGAIARVDREDWLTLLSSDVLPWRSRAVEAVPPKMINRVTFEIAGQETFAVERTTQGVWDLKTIPANMSERLLINALESLSIIRAVEWSSDKVHAKHGLDRPRLRVTLEILGREKSRVLEVGNHSAEEAGPYALLQEVPGVFVLSQTQYETITAPFQFFEE